MENDKELIEKFRQEYIRLDLLCADCFSVECGGISLYIKEMEEMESNFYDTEWKDTFYQLKHCRYIRNQLSHTLNPEPPTKKDLLFIMNLYEKILTGNDPLSLHKCINQKQIAYETNYHPSVNTTTRSQKPLAHTTSPVRQKKNDYVDLTTVILIFAGLTVLAFLIFIFLI